MKFQGAKISEQGITFGIVVVKESVLRNNQVSSEMQGFGMRAFGRIPIVLMAQNSRGIPTYKGRKDIVNFLANIDQSRIPYAEWSIDD
jgi:hypothetical protein